MEQGVVKSVYYVECSPTVRQCESHQSGADDNSVPLVVTIYTIHNNSSLIKSFHGGGTFMVKNELVVPSVVRIYGV